MGDATRRTTWLRYVPTEGWERWGCIRFHADRYKRMRVMKVVLLLTIGRGMGIMNVHDHR